MMGNGINPALASRPVHPGAESHGFAWKSVTVRSVNLDKRLALVIDDFGKPMEVRCDILRAKGNLPEPGEQWIIDRSMAIWTFAAIVNGTTRGVEVSNVTDLPESLQAINTAATNLQTATTGQVVAKGDLLGGIQAGVVNRLPVGYANLQTLTPDPTTPTGLAWKTPLALPQALPGADLGGRYVGQTISGPPTTGTFAAGDWVRDGNGLIWVCQAAGTPGTWVSGVQNRLSTAESSVLSLSNTAVSQASSIASQATDISSLHGSGKHIWVADGQALSGAGGDNLLTNWGQYYSDGIATLNGSSLFQFNRAGKWALHLYTQTDSNVAGSMLFYILPGNPSSWGPPSNTYLRTRAARATGFTNAGRIDQSISWVGRVAAADIYQALAVRYSWQATDGTSAALAGYRMMLEYLGPI